MVANSKESPTSVIQTTGPRYTRSKVSISKETSFRMKKNNIRGTHRKLLQQEGEDQDRHYQQNVKGNKSLENGSRDDNTKKKVYENHERRRYSIVKEAFNDDSDEDDGNEDNNKKKYEDKKKEVDTKKEGVSSLSTLIDQFVCGCSTTLADVGISSTTTPNCIAFNRATDCIDKRIIHPNDTTTMDDATFDYDAYNYNTFDDETDNDHYGTDTTGDYYDTDTCTATDRSSLAEF